MSQRFLRAVAPALFCALASVAYANLQDANENDDAKALGPAQAQAADDDSSLFPPSKRLRLKRIR